MSAPHRSPPISVESVQREAQRLGSGVSADRIAALAQPAPHVTIRNLRAG